MDNNTGFGFRIVNAATGSDCVNYLNQPYNNNSGNARLDNVAVNGQFSGSYAPTVTNSSSATVDTPFTNTFAVNAAWAAAIKSIYVNGVLMTNNNGYTVLRAISYLPRRRRWCCTADLITLSSMPPVIPVPRSVSSSAPAWQPNSPFFSPPAHGERRHVDHQPGDRGYG